MKAVLAMTLAAALGGCSTSIGTPADRDGGFASYDSLRAAQAACATKGGQFKLKRNGDPQYIGDYACERN